MMKATGCPVEPAVSPSFRGIEVGSNEGIEHCKRGGTIGEDIPGKEQLE